MHRYLTSAYLHKMVSLIVFTTGFVKCETIISLVTAAAIFALVYAVLIVSSFLSLAWRLFKFFVLLLVC